MSDKHDQFKEQLVDAVLDGKGVTDRALRTSVKTFAAAGGEHETNEGAIPAELRAYLRKVSRHAYKVTDVDVETLQQQGYSDDAIFELTVSAAVGAGLGRLEKGLAALELSCAEQKGGRR